MIWASGEPSSERTSVVVRRRRGLSRGVNEPSGWGSTPVLERPRLRDPGREAAVEDPRGLEAVDPQRPPGARGVQPQRVVVQDEGRRVADAGAGHERDDRIGRGEAQRVARSRRTASSLSSRAPVEVRRAGDVPGIEDRVAGAVRAPADVDDRGRRGGRARRPATRSRRAAPGARSPVIGGAPRGLHARMIGAWSPRSCPIRTSSPRCAPRCRRCRPRSS